jgi:hypothetical protein
MAVYVKKLKSADWGIDGSQNWFSSAINFNYKFVRHFFLAIFFLELFSYYHCSQTVKRKPYGVGRLGVSALGWEWRRSSGPYGEGRLGVSALGWEWRMWEKEKFVTCRGTPCYSLVPSLVRALCVPFSSFVSHPGFLLIILPSGST